LTKGECFAARLIVGLSSSESGSEALIQKNVMFRASANLVHKKCGQDVENHVYKTNLKPLYNHFSHMPKK